MTTYPVHTIDSAPEASKQALQGLQKSIGAVPNLAAAMAESPQLLTGFLSLREIFYRGTFTAQEVQALALANAFENGCRYCMALHSTFALKVGVSAEAVQALRSGADPAAAKLGALTRFSRRLVTHRGHAGAEALDAFIAAGYSRAQALEVVLGVAVSVLPNFSHQLTGCPIDAAFLGQQWQPEGARPHRDEDEE